MLKKANRKCLTFSALVVVDHSVFFDGLGKQGKNENLDY